MRRRGSRSKGTWGAGQGAGAQARDGAASPRLALPSDETLHSAREPRGDPGPAKNSAKMVPLEDQAGVRSRAGAGPRGARAWSPSPGGGPPPWGSQEAGEAGAGPILGLELHGGWPVCPLQG